MFFGSFFGIAHGAALPCMIIVFGDMIDLFVESGTYDYALDSILTFLNNLPNGTFTDPIPSKGDAFEKPELLDPFVA